MTPWWRAGRGAEPVYESRLPAETVRDLLRQKLEPELVPLGYEEVTPQRWVRSTFVPIRHVLEVHTLKSGIYTPFWYLSLDFVPHLTAARVTWHRTPKSVHPDLRYDPLDQIERDRWHEELDAWCVNPRGSRRSVGAAAERLAAWAAPRADQWLNRAQRVDQLPALFAGAEQLPSTRFSFRNYYKQQMSWAFAVAACGHEAEARSRLELFLDRHGDALTEAQQSELVERLTAVAQASRSTG